MRIRARAGTHSQQPSLSSRSSWFCSGTRSGLRARSIGACWRLFCPGEALPQGRGKGKGFAAAVPRRRVLLLTVCRRRLVPRRRHSNCTVCRRRSVPRGRPSYCTVCRCRCAAVPSSICDTGLPPPLCGAAECYWYRCNYAGHMVPYQILGPFEANSCCLAVRCESVKSSR